MNWAPLILFVAGLTTYGQERATLAKFDGHPSVLAVEGAPSFVTVEGSVGVASLRIEPDPNRDYYGVTLRQIPVGMANEIRFRGLTMHTTELTVRVRIEASGDGDRRSREVDRDVVLKPGLWTEVAIPLDGLKNNAGSAPLDFSRGINFLRISRRKRNDQDAAFLLDDLHLILAKAAAGRAEAQFQSKLKTKGTAETPTKDLIAAFLGQSDRARLAHAPKWLVDGENESCRRVARESFAAVGTAESLAFVRTQWGKAKGDAKLEWAYAAGGLETFADGWVAKQASQWTLEERVAFLQGTVRIGRRNFSDFSSVLGDLGAWPLATAYVGVLRAAETDEGFDALLALLGRELSPRARADVVDALARLSGRNLGDAVDAWQAWWTANRGKTKLSAKSQAQSTGYGSFYGIPMTPGRHAFVLDISGSMREAVGGQKITEHIQRSRHLDPTSIKTRLDLARAEVLSALRGLKEPSSFGIFAYNDEVTNLMRGYAPGNDLSRESATKRLNALNAGQKTNIHAGLWAAFHPGGAPSEKDALEGPDTLYLLSDGHPSVGLIQREDELGDAVLRWNLGRNLRLHTVNVGDRHAAWLSRLARATDGTYVDLSSQSEAKKDDSQ